jgi:spectinomycin phosphotransferase
VILYPYIEGQNGYQQDPSPRQWLEFGQVLQSIHRINLPVEISYQIPCEDFSNTYREQVKEFQDQAHNSIFHDSSAIRLAQFMREQQGLISRLLDRGDQLGQALKARPANWVLCHSDIHAGNLHLLPNDQLYIVDWDNPTFSPKERDLNLIGGCATWNQPDSIAWFYQGYGKQPIDSMALAYYRCERVLQDIAAYCEQLFLSTTGGEDREHGVYLLSSMFLPGHEIDIAMRTEP